jgi:hypothetical protein
MSSLRPSRALLHPTWLASLALLAVNDHVLKQGHVLPAWLTGKLSDAAGLFVAPALLAALLRVRTRRTLALAHGVVGASFVLVKTVPAATHVAEWLLSLVVPSRMWTDPTDLVALPALALAWRVLLPWMARGEAGRTRRALELAAGAVAGAACMATSQVYPPPKLKNESGRTLVVRIAPLDSSVSSDVPLTRRRDLPLTRALFVEGQRVVLHDGEEVDVTTPGLSDTTALLVDDGPAWVTDIQIGSQYRLTRGPGDTVAFEGVLPIVPLTLAPPACATNAVLSWEPLPAAGALRVRSVRDLGEGCRDVDFEGGSRPWRYCSPEAAWPFAVGDDVASTGSALVGLGPAPRAALVLSSSVEPIVEAAPACASVDACGGVLVEGVGRVGTGLDLHSGEVRSVTEGGAQRTYFAGTMRVAPIRSSRCGTPQLEGGYAMVDRDWKGAVPDAGAGADAEADAGAD